MFRLNSGQLLSVPATLALMAVIAACQPIAPEACPGADWYGIGVVDGEAGRQSRVAQFADVCVQQAGIVPDREAYEEGRSLGLRTYCTIDRGFEEGRKGRSDPANICPADLQYAVSQGWFYGNAIHSVEASIDTLLEDMDQVEAQLDAPDITAEQTFALQRELRALDRELQQLELSRNSIQNEYQQVKAQLEFVPPALGGVVIQPLVGAAG